MRLVGRTNKIIYPRAFFLPDEDEGVTPNDSNSWIYGVNEEGKPLLARLDLSIQRIKFDEETEEPEADRGPSLRHNSGDKLLPSVELFDDPGEKNWYCAAHDENGPDFGVEGSVILLSKTIALTGEALAKAREEFKNIYDEEMPEAEVYEAGYAKALNHGFSKELPKKTLKKMKEQVSAPVIGMGRLEMMASKPSEKTMIWSLVRNINDLQSYGQAKKHYEQLMRWRGEWMKLKKQGNQISEEGKARMQELSTKMKKHPGSDIIRNHLESLRAYAQWGETKSRLYEAREALAEDPDNDVLKGQVEEIALQADSIAIQSSLVKYQARILHPEDIVAVNFTGDDLKVAIQAIYDKYTAHGAYGGAYLRVLDPQGKTIPALGYNFQCRWLGEGNVSKAEDAVDYFAKQTDVFKSIRQHIKKGLTFELVPFQIIGAANKFAASKLNDYWLGGGGNTPMRDIFIDQMTGDPCNTYVAVSRRKSRNQSDSEFMASIAPTGFAGEVPTDYEIGPDGNAQREIRGRSKKTSKTAEKAASGAA